MAVETSLRHAPMQALLTAKFQLFGVLKQENGWHIAHCPPLDITTQGRTEAEAKKNLVEASELFVVSCFERGTFEQALRELGWHVMGGRAMRDNGGEPPKVPSGGFEFPVPVPFRFDKAASGCHA
jgi:predicted RNase H-like HicB family nuclease